MAIFNSYVSHYQRVPLYYRRINHKHPTNTKTVAFVESPKENCRGSPMFHRFPCSRVHSLSILLGNTTISICCILLGKHGVNFIVYIYIYEVWNGFLTIFDSQPQDSKPGAEGPRESKGSNCWWHTGPGPVIGPPLSPELASSARNFPTWLGLRFHPARNRHVNACSKKVKHDSCRAPHVNSLPCGMVVSYWGIQREN